MKALYRLKYGGPEVLEIIDVPLPKCGKNDVLVRVMAATISRTDCGILWGAPFILRFFTGLFKPKRQITGSDFSGIVELVGESVSRFKKGDRIWGFNDLGLQSHAEYLVVSANEAIAIIPDGVSYKQAAASAEGAHYAINAILSQNIGAGARVLVNGGTGAIGSAAIQLLKDCGAYVVATAPDAHINAVKQLGADEVIDFEKVDFTTCGQAFNLVFDAVGKSSWKKCKPLLLPGGTYVSSELGSGAQNLYLPVLTRFSSRKVKFPMPVDRKRTIALVSKLFSKKAFDPLIDYSVSLKDAIATFDYVNSGKKTGNVVIDFTLN